MTTLLPHQAFLAEKIAEWNERDPLLIQAPTGSGATAALFSQIRQQSERGWVLVTAPSQLSLEQWRERLRDWGLNSMTLTPDFALELADSHQRSLPHGLVLATYARLSKVRARQAVMDVPLSLLIVDGPLAAAGPVADALAELSSRAQQTIVLASSAAQPLPAWLQGAHRIAISLNFIQASMPTGRPKVVIRRVRRDPAVEALLRDVAEFLGMTYNRVRSVSRAAIHESLLRVATEANLADKHSEARVATAWRLVDALEQLGDDYQLEALREAVSSLRAAGQPIWIVASRVISEAEYIHGFLRSAGIEAILATSHTRWWATTNLSDFDAGDEPPIFVATTASLERLSLFVRGGSVVLMTVPSSEADRELLRTLLVMGVVEDLTLIVADGSEDSLMAEFADMSME